MRAHWHCYQPHNPRQTKFKEILLAMLNSQSASRLQLSTTSRKLKIKAPRESEPEESTSLSRLHDVLQAQNNDIVLEQFDIGKAPAQPSSQYIENMFIAGRLPHPERFPRDHSGKHFSISVLKCKKKRIA